MGLCGVKLQRHTKHSWLAELNSNYGMLLRSSTWAFSWNRARAQSWMDRFRQCRVRSPTTIIMGRDLILEGICMHYFYGYYLDEKFLSFWFIGHREIPSESALSQNLTISYCMLHYEWSTETEYRRLLTLYPFLSFDRPTTNIISEPKRTRKLKTLINQVNWMRNTCQSWYQG